jgi:curved DNA-binding protein CbpA
MSHKRRAALKWLELSVDAPVVTEEEVRTAYKRLAKLYHPDKNGGSAEAVARCSL